MKTATMLSLLLEDELIDEVKSSMDLVIIEGSSVYFGRQIGCS